MSIVKFKVEFRSHNPPDDARVVELREWCNRFNQMGLTPHLQGTGRSLGNLSFRIVPMSPVFIITGSTLDSKDDLGPADFVKVIQSDPMLKTVIVEGAKDPSSESMMHYEIYNRRRDIGAIFHGHDPEITAGAALLGLPETAQEALPGTIELLEQVMKILHDGNFLVMKNHGFLAFGKTMGAAGNLAMKIKNDLAAMRRTV